MSTLVLEVQFIDNNHSTDMEYATLEEVRTYLNGQREDDFEWLCLHDNNTDLVIDGWSDIHQYIRENNSTRLPETGTQAWSDLVQSELEDGAYDLSVCGPACNCMKCNTSKSSCIALKASELNLPVDDIGTSDLPRVERFGDLPDGTLFYLAQTYAYGGRQKYQKVLEDGGLHNAVLYTQSYSGIRVPDMKLVIRA